MVICWYQILTHSDQVFTAMLTARDAGFDFFPVVQFYDQNAITRVVLLSIKYLFGWVLYH